MVFGQNESPKHQNGLVERYIVSINCLDSDEIHYQKNCARNEIQNLINRKLNHDIYENLPLGKHRVTIYFNIDETGLISKIKSRSEFEILNIEFDRLFKLLPTNFRVFDENNGIIDGEFHLPFYITIIK